VTNSSPSFFSATGVRQTRAWQRFASLLRWGGREFIQSLHDLRQAALHWVHDEGGGLAASVSYYLALSLFPMMLLLSSGVGLFLKFSQLGQDAQGQILDVLAEHTSPVVRTQIEEVLLQMRDHALLSGPAGLVAATLAAIGVFSQFDRALSRIWGIKPIPSKGWRDSLHRFMTHRVSAFFMLIGLGIMLVMVFILNLCLTAFHTLAVDYLPRGERFLALGEMVVTIALNGLIFAILYRVIAKKSMRWDDAYRGGLIVALVWEAGRNVLGLTLIGMRYTTAYGVIGSFIALLAWCYYGVSVILFGAEYIQVIQERRKSLLSGPPLELPSATTANVLTHPINSAGDAAPTILPFPSPSDSSDTNRPPSLRIRPRRVA
jgi:membrane protein